MQAALDTVEVMDLAPTDVAGLVEELQEYHELFSPLFQRREQRQWSQWYLRGLLTSEGRKSVEPMVLSLLGAEDCAVRKMQHFLAESGWDDAPLLRRHWQAVSQTLGEEDGVLIVDGSDFPKQGQESVGVQRQYCGELGKRANCQAGVFTGYASSRGYTLLDKRLYLPQAWFSKAQAPRARRCGIPESVRFTTKPQLALEMIQAQVQAGTLPARWVTADEAFGHAPTFVDGVAACGLWYFTEVNLNTQVWAQRPATAVPARAARGPAARCERVLPDQAPKREVAQWAEQLAPERWQTMSLQEGSQGQQVADMAMMRVVGVRNRLPGPDLWLVFRRCRSSGELKAYLSNAPADTALSTFARISAMRWPIESCFEDGKQLLGMGDYEVRTWQGWHHHMSLCILAHHFLVRVQGRLQKKVPC